MNDIKCFLLGGITAIIIKFAIESDLSNNYVSSIYMEDIRYFLIGGITALIVKKLSELKFEDQKGGSPAPVTVPAPKKIAKKQKRIEEIDLTNLHPDITAVEDKDGMIVTANYSVVKDKKFEPMFLNPLNAKKISPTKSVHLVVPGLLPAPPKQWDNYSRDQIFYMPNDFMPHRHGEAQHHITMGFEVNRVFSVNQEAFIDVENKKLKEFRDELVDFNNGKSNTPVETWIHWRIPYDKIEYPTLTVKKGSIIWWDFKNTHNLNYVTKNSYDNNTAEDEHDRLLQTDADKTLQIIVTIMDKVGEFYFLCSIPGHGGLGHKITIKVVD